MEMMDERGSKSKVPLDERARSEQLRWSGRSGEGIVEGCGWGLNQGTFHQIRTRSDQIRPGLSSPRRAKR